MLVTLRAVEPRPDTQPELTWVSHAWRYAVCLVFSAAIWQTVARAEWQDHRLLFMAEDAGGGTVGFAACWRPSADAPLGPLTP